MPGDAIAYRGGHDRVAGIHLHHALRAVKTDKDNLRHVVLQTVFKD